MSDVDALLSRFIEEWNAARRPSVEVYVDQAPEGAARDDLAGQISTFLTYAPTPRYDESAMAELLGESAVQAAATAFESEGSAWRAMLPRLRHAGRTLPERVGRGGSCCGGPRRRGREKPARHLEAMERGELTPRASRTGCSPRLVVCSG